MKRSTHAIAPAMRRETTEAVSLAQAMIDEAETAARAELKAKDYTLCRHCQAGLTNFLIANPEATHEATQAETENLWETCGACSEEYHAHLSRQAAEWEERQRGLAYAEELNGTPMHEIVNGNGGAK